MYSFAILSHFQILLFGLTAVCIIFALAAFLLRSKRITRQCRLCEEADTSGQDFEEASIIVYSNDESDHLEELLPQLLAQEYPARFEVIVVNEGDSLQVRDLMTQLQNAHRNLYLTHTPDGARNLSRKKLAITLGIKAARYPVAVLTAAKARVDSRRWLQTIMQHFGQNSSTEVVLGFAAYEPYEDRSFGSRARSFDYAIESASWLSAAIGGHPWCGTEYNLAYRRDLFFNNKGFSKHLNLRHGDDDIFISEIATRKNTIVELSEDSIVRISGENSHRVARQRAAQRRFTERFINHRPRVLNTLAWGAYTIALFLPFAASALTPFNPLGWIVSGALLLFWYFSGLALRGAIKNLNGRNLRFTLPFLALTRPFRCLNEFISIKSHRNKRYTWE